MRYFYPYLFRFGLFFCFFAANTLFAAAPILTVGTAGNTLSFTEGGVAFFVDPSLTVSDTDSSYFLGGKLTASFVSGGSAGDYLSLSSQGSATGEVSVLNGGVMMGGTFVGVLSGGGKGGSLQINFNINATESVVQAVIRRLQYINTQEAPESAPKLLRLSLSDETNATSNFLQYQINLSPVNDLPVKRNLSTPITLNQGAVVALGNKLLYYTDVDNSPSAIFYTLSSIPGNGSLVLSASTLRSGDSFSQADINASRLAYRHDDSRADSASFSFVLSDGSGASLNPATVTFNITLRDVVVVVPSDPGEVHISGPTQMRLHTTGAFEATTIRGRFSPNYSWSVLEKGGVNASPSKVSYSTAKGQISLTALSLGSYVLYCTDYGNYKITSSMNFDILSDEAALVRLNGPSHLRVGDTRELFAYTEGADRTPVYSWSVDDQSVLKLTGKGARVSLEALSVGETRVLLKDLGNDSQVAQLLKVYPQSGAGQIISLEASVSSETPTAGEAFTARMQGVDSSGLEPLYRWDLDSDDEADTPWSTSSSSVFRLPAGNYALTGEILLAGGEKKSVSTAVQVSSASLSAYTAALKSLTSINNHEFQSVPRLSEILNSLLISAEAVNSETDAQSLVAVMEKMAQNTPVLSDRWSDELFRSMVSLEKSSVLSDKQKLSLLKLYDFLSLSADVGGRKKRMLAFAEAITIKDSSLAPALLNARLQALVAITRMVPVAGTSFMLKGSMSELGCISVGARKSAEFMNFGLPENALNEEALLAVVRFYGLREADRVGETWLVNLYSSQSLSPLSLNSEKYMTLSMPIPAGIAGSRLRLGYWQPLYNSYLDLKKPLPVATSPEVALFELEHLSEFSARMDFEKYVPPPVPGGGGCFLNN